MKLLSRLFVVSLIVLAVVVLLPQAAYAMGFAQVDTPPPLQVPQILIDAFAGFVTYYLLLGAQKYAPWLTGSVAGFVSVFVAALVTTLNHILAGVVDPTITFWIVQAFNILIAWLVSQGLFLRDKAMLKSTVPKAAAAK